MKKFLRSAATGQLGHLFVERIALEAGCKPVSYPVEKDSGLDGHIEFVVNEEVTGKLVAFQVKHGPSFWRGKPFVQTDKSELTYWRNHDLPVIMIVVKPDGKAAYWMDVKAHIDKNPSVVDSGPYTLYPPLRQPFDTSSLMSKVFALATMPDFGTVVRNLSSTNEDARLSGLETAIAFRRERRACFALIAALIFERDLGLMREFCDVLSRYLSHPEVSFSDVPKDVEHYIKTLLSELPDETLVRILSSFQTEDFFFAGPGVQEIYRVSDDNVWGPHDIFERGSYQQSMAVVAGVIGKGRFARIIKNTRLSIEVRCAAIALYADYDRRGLSSKVVRRLMAEASDDNLRAWLYWLLRLEHGFRIPPKG